MPLDHRERLDALGFIWDPNKEAWEQGFNELLKFREREGHCKVPASYKTNDGFALGTWVNNRRREQNVLSQDRIYKLQAIGLLKQVSK